MSEHTPGPWEVDADNQADARLIAAAPDLLAALESVEFVFDLAAEDHVCPSCHGERPISKKGRRGHGPGCVLRAAIAKAKGETA